MQQNVEQFASAQGATVLASDGEEIGKVEEIFYDHQTSRPEWIGIGSGTFGTKRVLVRVEGADLRDDGLFVPYPTTSRARPSASGVEAGQTVGFHVRLALRGSGG